MSSSKEKLVFIGAGQMAAAIIGGLLDDGKYGTDNIVATDPYDVRREYMTNTFDIDCIKDNPFAVKDATLVVLAVKPQSWPEVAAQLRTHIPSHACVLSIMAGITMRQISEGLDHDCVVRTIPNTPAIKRQGVNVWTCTESVSAEQADVVQGILASLGVEVRVKDERMIDCATGLSGSGPAFVLLFLESLVEAGVRLGFSWSDAKKIALQLVGGTVAMATDSPLHLAELRNQVTSPGGTTAAGLHQLEKGSLRTTVDAAVFAAAEKSMALSKL